MKPFIFAVVICMLTACGNKEEQTEQARKENADLFTKPYTEKIPPIGNEKMKIHDWSSKSSSK